MWIQQVKAGDHPFLFPGNEIYNAATDERIVSTSGKMVVLDQILKRCLAEGNRVLIFSQYVKMLDILDDYLVYREIKFFRIDGQTAYAGRAAQIAEFNAPESDFSVFILSTHAAGLGINLQTANTVCAHFNRNR
jgi:SNF2 family DNA or RNA helicase